ncbi:MAG: ferredoxin family protein [Solirubrobacterales bacterium]
MEDQKGKVNIDEKLYMNSYDVDSIPHLSIKDPAVCEKCSKKTCVNICPAHVYEWTEGHITVSYEGCLECGACRIGCCHNNIEWSYPRGGFGIQFKLA